MNLADIIQIKIDLRNAGYVVQSTVSKTKYRCFSDTAVALGLLIPYKFELWPVIDLLDQTVYMVDYDSYPRGEILRWIHPRYETAFASELFECQEDPTKNSADGTQIRRYHTDGIIPSIIRGDMLGPNPDEDNEEYESVELELTDSELATIARAAHVKDITINDFINEALKIELDHVMPDWREEYK